MRPKRPQRPPTEPPAEPPDYEGGTKTRTATDRLKRAMSNDGVKLSGNILFILATVLTMGYAIHRDIMNDLDSKFASLEDKIGESEEDRREDFRNHEKRPHEGAITRTEYDLLRDDIERVDLKLDRLLEQRDREE